jgi:hypothetical protein
VQVWRGSVGTITTSGILAFGWTFSWLWFGLSAWSLVILSWCIGLGERCATLFDYWSTSIIILYANIKVLGGGLCAYGWVTILLYCVWKNEHISLFLTTKTTLQDVGDHFGDPIDTRRTQYNFDEPPLSLTAIELMPTMNLFLVQYSYSHSYGEVVENSI